MSKWRDLWVADYSTKILLWWENLLCHLSKEPLINSAVMSGHGLGKVFSQLWTLSCEWHETLKIKIPLWCDRHAYPSILLHHGLSPDDWTSRPAGHYHLRSPAGARRRHQGAPGTRHVTIRPVSLATRRQPTVFSRPAEAQPPPCHSSKNETQNLHRVLKYVLSPLSVSPSRSTYTFFFFFFSPFQ